MTEDTKVPLSEDLNKITDAPGVYMIKNNANGKVYVGRAVNVQKRWVQHRHYLRREGHHNQPLQHSWRKYGEKSFSFLLLVGNVTREEDLCALEDHYIRQYRATDRRFGYNLCPSSGTNRGLKYSDESRARMSAAQKGRTFTDDAKRRISASLKGRSPSLETREKRRQAMKGRSSSPDHVAKVRAALRQRNGTKEYEAFGKSQTLRDWADEYGINKATLRNRVVRGGYPLEVALTAPIKEKTHV